MKTKFIYMCIISVIVLTISLLTVFLYPDIKEGITDYSVHGKSIIPPDMHSQLSGPIDGLIAAANNKCPPSGCVKYTGVIPASVNPGYSPGELKNMILT